jgi:hypothetical protein
MPTLKDLDAVIDKVRPKMIRPFTDGAGEKWYLFWRSPGTKFWEPISSSKEK